MQEADTLKAMVAGHICLDITPGFNPMLEGSFDEIFAPGKLINVRQAVIGTGGAVSNTGLAMARLGIDVKLNGKVGNDEFGRLIKDIVGRDRSLSFKTVSDQSSSYTVVLALPGVDRIFLHHPGTNDTFTAEDIDYEALSECSLLHLGYPPLMRKLYENDGCELLEIFKKAKELGVVTSLDMTVPDPNSDSGKADWQKIFSRVLPYVDIFIPSVEEIAYMLDGKLFDRRKAQSGGNDPVLAYSGSDCSSLSDRILDMGVKIAGIKVGIKGCYLRTASRDVIRTLTPIADMVDQWSSREIWAGSYKSETFGSATGAGDATIAGFLMAFLQGMKPVETVKTANVLGWQNVRKVDTLSGIEDWPTTVDMINDRSKELNPLQIDDADWQFDKKDRLYFSSRDSFYNNRD